MAELSKREAERLYTAAKSLTLGGDGGNPLELDISESKTIEGGVELKRWVARCVKCGEIVPLAPCSNCGRTKFSGTGMVSASDGIMCEACKLAYGRWRCEACDTSNPLEGTVGELYTPLCFIATAVYGSAFAPEVVLLKRFRDEILSHHTLGKAFVAVYNRISPPLAARLVGSRLIGGLVRHLLVGPSVAVARLLLGDPCTDSASRDVTPS